jgi:hypothetical protein
MYNEIPAWLKFSLHVLRVCRNSAELKDSSFLNFLDDKMLEHADKEIEIYVNDRKNIIRLNLLRAHAIWALRGEKQHMIEYAMYYVTSVTVPEFEDHGMTIGLSTALTKNLKSDDPALYERTIAMVIRVIEENTKLFGDSWSRTRSVEIKKFQG